MPIAVPKIKRESGNKTIIKIINGNERRILTINDSVLLKIGFGIIPFGAVVQRRVPIGNPRITENIVLNKTISSVCKVESKTKSNI